MSTRVVIMFPYSGYKKGSKRQELFWEMLLYCQERTPEVRPIVVLNRDTEIAKNASAFLAERPEEKGIEICRVWSVDTCQMWLAGWGYVIDRYPQTRRIVQLPGDIDSVSNPTEFITNLGNFIRMEDPWDIVIGDFSTGNRFNAKELIDWYGTYALLANWFPGVAVAIRRLGLNRPRSEFLNIRVATLKALLAHRKFGYEQTVNMLIRYWYSNPGDWELKILSQMIGELADDNSLRQYRDCLDQIERTERMLKVLWREFNEPRLPTQSKSNARSESKYKEYKSKYEEFIEEYDTLDRHSTSIRENSRIIIRNLLEKGETPGGGKRLKSKLAGGPLPAPPSSLVLPNEETDKQSPESN